MEFKIGDKIKIIKKPACWSSGGGKCPLDLSYPRDFTISSIIPEEGNWFSIGTEEGYGFSSDSLNSDNTIIIKTQKTMCQKLNSMMKRLLDADTKKLIRADLINGALLLTDEGKEALISILFEQNKAELVKMAEEIIAEQEKEK